MKFTVTMKDPDAVYEAVNEAAKKSLDTDRLTAEEIESVLDIRHRSIADKIKRWVKFGEYITVEFDTEANTATVLKV